MHHLLVYSSSIANGAVLADCSPIVDEVFAFSGTTALMPEVDKKILRAYAFGDLMSEVQYNSPLLRPIGPPEIQPFETAATPSNLPPINLLDDNYLPWTKNDPLGFKISRAGAGALVCKVGLWVADMPQTRVTGPTFSVQATAAVTLTVSSWVSAPLVFGQALPPGRWRIVGMAAQGTGLFAARLLLPGQVQRPGALAQQASGEFDMELFRRGKFGDYGQFEAFAPPTAQFHGFTAGAITATVILDLQPVNVGKPTWNG